MPVDITLDEANRLLFEQGAFNSLETLVRLHGVSFKTEARILGEFFRSLLPQITEAQKETQHIQAALARMEQTCRHGRHIAPRGFGQRQSPLIEAFQRDLWPFDGWVISLLETNLTLIGFVYHPTAVNRVSQLNQSLTALLLKRRTDLVPFLKDPFLFADYFKV